MKRLIAVMVIFSFFMILENVYAAGGKAISPTGIAPDRYAYYPGTEELGSDEIRLIACGTGMPSARRSQAATCFLVELGNGDKVLFDIGSGSHANIASLMIPSDFLRKVFITHLHTDHWGDLASLWAGGWTAGRTAPLQVWGPSGAREDMGTKYAIEHMLKAYNWDYMTRAVTINPGPGGIKVHEFDYRAINEVVYEENGVTFRSWPCIHAGDGPVELQRCLVKKRPVEQAIDTVECAHARERLETGAGGWMPHQRNQVGDQIRLTLTRRRWPWWRRRSAAPARCTPASPWPRPRFSPPWPRPAGPSNSRTSTRSGP